jgi:acyl carrier protein
VTEHLAPRTELEAAVAQVWAEVLGTPSVGVRDHFFDELGGTSLLVAKVTSALGDRLGREIPVTHLFEYPTVETLAGQLAPIPADHLLTHPADTAPEDQAAARHAALARRAGARHGMKRGRRA